jgi:hypothetical protein
MKQIRIFLLSAVITLTGTALGQGANIAAAASAPRATAAGVADLKASDGTILKASYFAAAKPGPGVG